MKDPNPRHTIEIPHEISIGDAADACAEAGYGAKLPEDYSNSDPVVVRVNGVNGIMPQWMAEVFGHIGRTKP